MMAAPRSSWPRSSAFASAAFCAYIIIWFMQVGVRWPALGAVRIEFLWAIALTLLGVLNASSDRYRLFSNAAVRWAVVLLGLMAAHVVASRDPETSWLVFFDRVVKFSFMGLFILWFGRSPRSLRWVVGALLFAWFYITQESFRGALNGSMIWQNQGIPRLHGTTPLYRHPNSLAGLAIGVFPFLYFLFPVFRSKVARLFLLGLAVTAGGCVLYSGSRTGYLAAFFFLVGVFWKSKRKGWLLAGVVGLTVAMTPFLPAAYVQRFQTIFADKGARGGSAEKRVQIIRDAVDVFVQHPMGVGVGAFPKVREEMFGRFQDTHNLYLEVATNLGVPGLLVFAAFVLALFKSLKTSARRLSDARQRSADLESGEMDDLRFLEALVAATQVYLMVRLALGLFGHDLYEIYWWLVLGLTGALDRLSIAAGQIHSSRPVAPPLVASSLGSR